MEHPESCVEGRAIPGSFEQCLFARFVPVAKTEQVRATQRRVDRPGLGET